MNKKYGPLAGDGLLADSGLGYRDECSLAGLCLPSCVAEMCRRVVPFGKYGPLFCQKGLENSYSGVFGVKLRSHVLGFLISRAVAENTGGVCPPYGDFNGRKL